MFKMNPLPLNHNKIVFDSSDIILPSLNRYPEFMFEVVSSAKIYLYVWLLCLKSALEFKPQNFQSCTKLIFWANARERILKYFKCQLLFRQPAVLSFKRRPQQFCLMCILNRPSDPAHLVSNRNPFQDMPFT